MAEINLVDGFNLHHQVLDIPIFKQNMEPKIYSGSYGQMDLGLDFSDNSATSDPW